jgi:hypothetical protein
MLIAQRLYPARLELVGEPVRVAEQIGSFASFGFFSASTNGVLVYRVTNQNSQLTWFDRQGTVLGVVGEPVCTSRAVSDNHPFLCRQTGPELR